MIKMTVASKERAAHQQMPPHSFLRPFPHTTFSNNLAPLFLALLLFCEELVWISVNQLEHSSDALNLSMSDSDVEKRVTVLVLGQK